ncbi:MAG: hypothetical protein HZC17_00045 [Candidatus Omnitrophica bacterium]|nr:hypothetical protein [Candidatus Omnitrophota bacterium]
MIAYGFVSFLWGFLEGTCFFLVPDIWLTFLACRKERDKWLTAAVIACIIGALAGGITMYFAAQHVGNRIFKGLFSIFIGVFQGIPYKIFASEWGALRGSLWLFILISIFARGIRFVFAVVLTRLIRFLGESKIPHWAKIKYVLLILFWVTFYSFYFIRHGI